LAAAGLAAGVAFAGDDDGPDRGGRWEKLDANGDGVITLNELDSKQSEFFAEADSDGDGALSKEEMKAHHQKKRAGKMAQHLGDENGDGVVDRSEYDAAADVRFDKLDADGNGVISEEELAAGRRTPRGKRSEK
jgi:hypothetical protein